MSSAARIDSELFAGAPFLKLLERCRVLRSGRSNLARRAAISIMVAWAPLAVLTIAQGDFYKALNSDSFLPDIAVHARFLIALPLLVMAEVLLVTQLSGVVRHFLDIGVIRSADRTVFDEAVLTTRESVGSLAGELTAIALGYALVAALLISWPLQNAPGWQLTDPESGQLSWAGWWHALVSLPILIIAFLGMLWRWCLWVRLLWRISRMKLALIPAHPDGVGGLKFVSYSVRAFTAYGLLLGVIVAGSAADRVIYEDAPPSAYAPLVGGLAAFVVVLFSSPMTVFTRTLLSAWRRGVYQYDALADRVGRQFEAQWFRPGGDAERDALSRPDFSATADLYSVASNVYGMRLFLFDWQGVLLVACATVAPFVPVLLFAVPLDTVLARIAGVLL